MSPVVSVVLVVPRLEVINIIAKVVLLGPLKWLVRFLVVHQLATVHTTLIQLSRPSVPFLLKARTMLH